ncbi:Zn-ribbon domain-containing OB-fold protein [Cupriavidus sp. AcVe19-1a]|uniref:Zn-ribbon domain-containing OB-fold protein n=1 Tax=Cupriavidus sp. AcVe19-1a TaxID=2821359 RepID=UPI001AE74357|nr:Zn-ribbon domain-containing OB-fold protein [Cupriavidus sp. AcVe19-1a]MBP0630489.1 Zn-ribbon domain-containing OB-fold protein [Cupriavidus sp. AcVe19-1a]
MTTNYPLPRPNAQTQPFWDGCAEGELRYQRCASCGHVQCIPRSLCEQCHGTDLHWRASSRLGTVLTFTTVYRAPLPVFKDMVPYVIAIIDMDDGFRVMANALPPAGQKELAIGSRVRIDFTDVHGMALPVVGAFVEDAK